VELQERDIRTCDVTSEVVALPEMACYVDTSMLEGPNNRVLDEDIGGGLFGTSNVIVRERWEIGEEEKEHPATISVADREVRSRQVRRRKGRFSVLEKVRDFFRAKRERSGKATGKKSKE